MNPDNITVVPTLSASAVDITRAHCYFNVEPADKETDGFSYDKKYLIYGILY